MSVVKVIVAEDCLLIRDSVCRALATAGDVEVAGVGADFDAAVRLVADHEPDLLITDVRMPPTGTDEGIRLAAWLRTAHPATGVIVLSQYAEPAYAAGLVAGGSAGRGYLLKERIADFGQLVNAVHVVAAGGSVLDPVIMEALLSTRGGTLARLTARERQVLEQLAAGDSNRVVAQRLVLSQRAVEKHINAIFAKLGLTRDPEVDPRVKAVLMYLGARK